MLSECIHKLVLTDIFKVVELYWYQLSNSCRQAAGERVLDDRSLSTDSTSTSSGVMGEGRQVLTKKQETPKKVKTKQQKKLEIQKSSH